MEALKQAVREVASRYGDGQGPVATPVPGLGVMAVAAPTGPLHATYKPVICLVLQGAKHMVVGTGERTFYAGQSVIVSADTPVTGRIVEASREAPYLAVAVELDAAVLREIAVEFADPPGTPPPEGETLFVADADAAILDCAMRLMRLLDRPAAIPVLHPGIMRELHYWLLSGRHGPTLRALALPESHASRLAAAVAILRGEYRSHVPVERLAAASAMSLTAFHKHFKRMTTLTPGQFQKRLRLIEARRLMLEDGFSATAAAFEVGYESSSQFSRDYGRMYGAPPKRDSLRLRTARPASTPAAGEPLEPR